MGGFFNRYLYCCRFVILCTSSAIVHRGAIVSGSKCDNQNRQNENLSTVNTAQCDKIQQWVQPQALRLSNRRTSVRSHLACKSWKFASVGNARDWRGWLPSFSLLQGGRNIIHEIHSETGNKRDTCSMFLLRRFCRARFCATSVAHPLVPRVLFGSVLARSRALDTRTLSVCAWTFQRQRLRVVVSRKIIRTCFAEPRGLFHRAGAGSLPIHLILFAEFQLYFRHFCYHFLLFYLFVLSYKNRGCVFFNSLFLSMYHVWLGRLFFNSFFIPVFLGGRVRDRNCTVKWAPEENHGGDCGFCAAHAAQLKLHRDRANARHILALFRIRTLGRFLAHSTGATFY